MGIIFNIYSNKFLKSLANHYLANYFNLAAFTKKKKKMWLSEEALQLAEKKDVNPKAKEKRKDTPIQMHSSKEEQGETRKPSSVINAKQ